MALSFFGQALNYTSEQSEESKHRQKEPLTLTPTGIGRWLATLIWNGQDNKMNIKKSRDFPFGNPAINLS